MTSHDHLPIVFLKKASINFSLQFAQKLMSWERSYHWYTLVVYAKKRTLTLRILYLLLHQILPYLQLPYWNINRHSCRRLVPTHNTQHFNTTYHWDGCDNSLCVCVHYSKRNTEESAEKFSARLISQNLTKYHIPPLVGCLQ